MNAKRFGAIAILAFVTAAGPAFVSVRADESQDVTSSPDTTRDVVQFARGAKAWSENCGRCHNLRDPQEFSDKNWDIIVNHMRTLAPLPGGMAQDIKAFLKESN